MVFGFRLRHKSTFPENVQGNQVTCNACGSAGVSPGFPVGPLSMGYGAAMMSNFCCQSSIGVTPMFR